MRVFHLRDVTLREDASRLRKNPGIFAKIRSFAYNILRFNQRDSVAQDRYAAALGGLNTQGCSTLYSLRKATVDNELKDGMERGIPMREKL